MSQFVSVEEGDREREMGGREREGQRECERGAEGERIVVIIDVSPDNPPVPEEEEVLYPPLTYLRPISVQCISNKKGQAEGKVVLVKPSFPS